MILMIFEIILNIDLVKLKLTIRNHIAIITTTIIITQFLNYFFCYLNFNFVLDKHFIRFLDAI